MRSRCLVAVYTGITTLCQPLLHRYLKKRCNKGQEDPLRYTEKMAVPSQNPPENQSVIWIHGVSVGESVSALPLVQACVDKGYFVVLTTTTVTAGKIMEKRLPQGAIHQYMPLDCTPWIRRFLRHWNPNTVIFLESELWYNTLREIHKQNIPLYLVNARFGQKTIKRCQKYPHIARTILQFFTKIYPQNNNTLTTLTHIFGTKSQKIESVGNLKYASCPAPVNMEQVRDLHSQIGNRPVWLIASTHSEDEQIVAEALPKILQVFPNIVTLIVPRHPERIHAVQTTFQTYTQAIRSQQQKITANTQVYIADTMGELPIFYTISPLCLVGGSFEGGYGGHNPLEPAHYHSAILQGYNTNNFADITDALNTSHAHQQVQDADALAHVVCDILSHPDKGQKMAQNAKKFVDTQHNIVPKLLKSMGI